ncbi:MAG: CPBP family intramembrane glutamic endopeptidase [Planctomycetota bacterium]|jgi:membrane protease YdiL (CAAX protease family)
MHGTGRVSRPRFWGLLIAFLAANFLIARLFGWVVRTLGLENSTRTLYRDVAADGPGPALANLALNWLPQALLVLLACALFLRLLRLDVRAALALRIRRDGAWVLPAGLVLLFLYHLVVRQVRGVPAPAEGPGLAFVALYALRFLPSALVEEMVFRGSLFFSLGDRYGAPAGFAVSVLLFGLAHLYGGGWLFVNALILGSVFTLAYRRTRSLGVATLLHAFSNVVYACLHYGG